MTASAPPESSAVEEAVERFAAGEPVLVAGLDGSAATVALPAARVTVRRLATLQELSGGMVVVGVDANVAERLNVDELIGATRHAPGLRLASPVDARDCREGGWSLDDRVRTIRVAGDPASTPADLTVPGHVHTGLIDGASLSAPTAALELAYATSQAGAVLLGPLVDSAGGAVALAQVAADRRLQALPVARIEELWWSGGVESAADSIACSLPTRLGDFEVRAAVTRDTGETIVTLVHGDASAAARAHATVHLACLLGDTFGSLLCDCHERLEQACEGIRADGAGVLIYVKPLVEDPFSCPRTQMHA